MDVDTSAAIERLSERIDVLDATVREGFTSLRGGLKSMREEVGTLRGELGGELATVRRDVGSVREELGTVRGELGGELATVRRDVGSVREELGTVRGKLGGEIATARRDLEKSISDLRAETRDGLAENRRHTEVLFESLRDDIRILAEGFASVSLKLDSLQR
jgi:hypothetical protein